jgi:hypothetical protein
MNPTSGPLYRRGRNLDVHDHLAREFPQSMENFFDDFNFSTAGARLAGQIIARPLYQTRRPCLILRAPTVAPVVEITSIAKICPLSSAGASKTLVSPDPSGSTP